MFYWVGGGSSSSRKVHIRWMEVKEVYSLIRPFKTQKFRECTLTFTEKEAKWVLHHYDDALLVTLCVANYTTRQILIDNSSLAGVLFIPVFD